MLVPGAVSVLCGTVFREVLEHQPRSLTLAVNGHIVATQDVSFAVCKQDVEINLGTPFELIEALSEQGLCLLVMPVLSVPRSAPPEIYRQVRLSCGRTVEAWLRFTSMGPRVETSYREPALLSSAEKFVDPDSVRVSASVGVTRRNSVVVAAVPSSLSDLQNVSIKR